jgi:hypothetical protein
MSEIGLVEVSGEVQQPAPLAAAVAPDLPDSSTLTLRFLLSAEGEDGLEALRNARRSLLREEWTRGRDSDEPSLEDAVFSPTEILWVVRPDQRPLCLLKLEELRRRANLLLSEMDGQPD